MLKKKGVFLGKCMNPMFNKMKTLGSQAHKGVFIKFLLIQMSKRGAWKIIILPFLKINLLPNCKITKNKKYLIVVKF
jgi:hypothetical protein